MSVQVSWKSTYGARKHTLLALLSPPLERLELRAETDVRLHGEIENPLILPLKAYKLGRCASLNNK